MNLNYMIHTSVAKETYTSICEKTTKSERNTIIRRPNKDVILIFKESEVQHLLHFFF